MNQPIKLCSDPDIGEKIYQFMRELYPLCRSITGDGVRKTFELMKHRISVNTHEVPSGTAVFDWTVPKEWNIKDAYVKNARGEKIIDFASSNLHVMSYSQPIHRKVSLQELREHIFTLPDNPDWIPYRTSYYKENWGFCLDHTTFKGLEEGEYEVMIDSSLKDGHLTYGEYFIEGKTTEEVLIYTHVCHPSLCNDNLSGVVLATYLADYLSRHSRRYSYRFIWAPGTIGSITWLCLNERKTSQIKHGLVLANIGDSGKSTYKKSRRASAEIDTAVLHVLKHSGDAFEVEEFSPYGYDERQFCSPGFNLPVGCLMRTPHGQFPEYHTSADNLSFVQPQFLADSFFKCLAIVNVLEGNKTYINQNQKCEPRLGKRGLYGAVGGQTHTKPNEIALLWVLNLSDGQHTLLDIAERSGVDFDSIRTAADSLVEHNLLREPVSQ